MSANDPDTESVGNFLNHIPFGYAIGAPLNAIIQGQGLAAQTTIDFINEVGLEKDKQGNTTNTVRTIDMSLDKNGQKVDLKAPLLAMVNVPFIRISQGIINLDCKIHDLKVSDKKDANTKNITAGGGLNAFFWSAKIETQVSYTSSKEVKSTFDKSGEIKVNVVATQDAMPAGLKDLLHILKESMNAPVTPKTKTPQT